MSDISIPGVTSKYDTQKLVEDLMKVERIPKTRAEERLKEVELQRTSWIDLNRRLSSLRESSRSLFSFQNPFNDRIATSTDESVLTGTAAREAIEETKSFTVKRVATADRFMSGGFPSDYKVPAGNYIFTVGESSVKLNYGGGSLKDFVDALNRKGGDTIRAQVVAVSADSRVLVIESLKTGSTNRLGFSGDAEDFALSSGLVERATTTRKELPASGVSRFEKALDPKLVSTTDGILALLPGSEAALRLASAVPAAGLVLELREHQHRHPVLCHPWDRRRDDPGDVLQDVVIIPPWRVALAVGDPGRVENEHAHPRAAGEGVERGEGVPRVLRLHDEQAIQVDALLGGPGRGERVLRVDQRGEAPGLLCLGHRQIGKRRFARRGEPLDLRDPDRPDWDQRVERRDARLVRPEPESGRRTDGRRALEGRQGVKGLLHHGGSPAAH